MEKRHLDKESSLGVLALFWKFAKKRPRSLVLSLLLFPINIVLISTLIPWLISQMINQLALQGHHQNLTPFIIKIILCAVIGLWCNYLGYKIHFSHLVDTYADIMRKCFDILTKRGEYFYANQFTGALTKYSIDFPNSYSSIETVVMSNILPMLTRVISGVIIVSIGGAPWLGLLLLLITVVTFYRSYKTRAVRQSIRTKRRDAQTAINSHLADVITNNQTMRIFARWKNEDATNKSLVKKWKVLMLEDFRLLNIMFNRILQTNLAMQVGFVLLLVALVNAGTVSIGVAIFCVTYLTRFATEILGLGGIINQTENALIDAAPMLKIMSEEPEVVDAIDAKKIIVTSGNVSFKDVNFAYEENASKKVLPNFNLTIQSGEKVALVGPSGGGKTTITKLLLRLLDIQSGEINIDNQNIAHVTQQSLRETIAYVPQEPILFHRSLLDNISYHDLGNISKSSVVAAAKKAHADEFISLLPHGYDTMVGERGVKLSGGQRQRVAIARAILKNAPILILDEATSALDSESEKLIQDALNKLMEDRTTIVIAHRLSTIQKMDRIIVLDDGKIVEEGSHTELLKNNGLYAKLWAHQSGGFLED